MPRLACLSSSRRPIIVVAFERRISSVSAMMAAVADDASVSCLRKVVYDSRIELPERLSGGGAAAIAGFALSH